MLEFITDSGISVDLLPNQEVAITIENAFFATDHIPVAWTTDIEMPPSKTNCVLFGLPNAMLINAARTKIDVAMHIGGISVMRGKLQLLGSAEGILNASFTGVAIEDSLTGQLQNAPFNKWNFGKLGELDDQSLYKQVIISAEHGTRDDFATPLMIRSSCKESTDIYMDMNTVACQQYYATKFLNCLQGDFMTPVIRLKYMLQVIFADCEIDADFTEYMNKIGIVAPYRTNGSISDLHHKCLDKDDAGNFVLDLANAMPDVAIEDFVKNVLCAFCATVFIAGGQKRMISNKSIILDSNFEDWSNKIADNIGQEYNAPQSYEYGFSRSDDTEIKETIHDYQTLESCFDAPENSIIRCLETKDYYRLINKSIRLGMTNGESVGYKEPYLILIKQGGMTPKNTPNKDRDVVSNVCNLAPVKCYPYRFFQRFGSFGLGWTSIMAPVIDIPAVGSARPTDIYFGTLEIPGSFEDRNNPFANHEQLTSNGCYGQAGMWISVFEKGTTPLSMSGDSNLYDKFHKDYAVWLEKDKTITKIEVNLSKFDIANLQIWRKIMLYNRLFFIKTLTIMLNTSKDEITTEADIVSA